MTRDLGIVLRVVRLGIALLVLLATAAVASPTSAATGYTITTLRNSQGKVIFSLRPTSVAFGTAAPTLFTSAGGSLPYKYASKATISTLTARYKLTTLSKSLLGSAPSGHYYTLIYKVMSGTTPSTCVLKEQLAGAWVIKAQLNFVQSASNPYPTDTLTYTFASIKRVTC